MMTASPYWSRETNPETGEQFENYIGYMWRAGNNEFDLNGFLNSEYGTELARRLHREYTLERDPMGDAARSYAASCGLKKELFDNEEFYTRWVIYTPLHPVPGKKYPLVFMLHGGGDALEAGEYIPGYVEIAAKEGFIPVFPQNTNPDNLVRLLGIIRERYPVDPERVYVTGHSQGGTKTFECAHYLPEVFAAMGPCNGEQYRLKDSTARFYTDEDRKRLHDAVLPCVQLNGMCEMGNITPANVYRPHINEVHTYEGWKEEKKYYRPNFTPEMGRLWAGYLKWEETRSPDQRIYLEKDPTKMVPPGATLRVVPPYGIDADRWKLEKINEFLAVQGVTPRDIDRCLAYRDSDDEFHRLVGIYGDGEAVETYYGYRHYREDFYNEEGINTYRVYSVENCYHTFILTQARLTWEFFKMFRRDSVTGKIVVDEYRPD